jgi:tripartite-type tricarboxylate transporter receptor subunit TctC
MRRLLLAAMLALCTGSAEAFPDRPVRIIVPFPPGGASDIVARLLAERAGRDLAHKFVVENRSGANGNIGMEAVARSPADGYTLGQCTIGNCAINAAIYTRMPYDIATELTPVFWSASVMNLLAVRNELPIRTVQDFIAYARANPGRMQYGSSGFGSSNHLAPEMLKGMFGLDILHVPFRGGAPAMQALIGGQVDFMLENVPTLVAAMRDGRFRGVAVTGAARDPAIPDIPTFEEGGLAGFIVEPWFGFMAPRGTPEAAVNRLNALFNEALADEVVRARLADLGARPRGGSPADFAAHVQAELAKWKQVVETNKIERLQ